jgi:hypothetical protein
MAAPSGGAGLGTAAAATASMDVETIVISIVAAAPRKMLLARQEFEPYDPTLNDMLQWEDSRHKFAQIQALPGGELVRIGTVGDGNCLLHSFLFALSPTYRAHNKAARSHIADEFRNILISRADELRNLADITYPDIGGSVGLEESFEILEGAREEINIEMAPLIAQLYGFNLLAVQVRSDMSLHPVCATFIAYNPTLPTVLVNYIGGGLDIGNTAEGFMPGGHYEAIFAPKLVFVEEPAAKRTSTRRKKEEMPRVAIDSVHTRYTFRHEDLTDLLAVFTVACRPQMSAEAAALRAAIDARGAVVPNLVPRRRRRTVSSGRRNSRGTRKHSKKTKSA